MTHALVSRLQFKDVGHSGPARGALAGCTAEGVEVGAEHKIVPLTQRNAEATQGSFDPGPLRDTAAVRAARCPSLSSSTRVAVHWRP